jgi:hypothetical protein
MKDSRTVTRIIIIASMFMTACATGVWNSSNCTHQEQEGCITEDNTETLLKKVQEFSAPRPFIAILTRHAWCIPPTKVFHRSAQLVDHRP